MTNKLLNSTNEAIKIKSKIENKQANIWKQRKGEDNILVDAVFSSALIYHLRL